MTAISLRQLEAIEAEIREHSEGARQGARLTITHCAEVGKRLMAARKILPAGKFGEWTHERFGWSRMQTARYCKIARNVSRVLQQVGPDASMRQALRCLAPPEKAQKWLLVGELDAEPDGDLAQVAAGVKLWKVRKG